MKKDKLIVLFASLVTVILGPGAGHLIIKEWKKAAFFISLALGLFLILCMNFVSEVGHETLSAVLNYTNINDIEQFKNIWYKFQDDNPNMMLIFNIFFSGLWAYSIVDIFLTAKKKGIFNSSKEKEEK